MSVGRVRPSVAALGSYRPGKGAKQAEAEHGITNAIKLASNENPYNPVPKVMAAVAEAASGSNRYSDHRATELRSKIAQWLGLDQNQITVGCGSVSLIQQLCLAYIDPGDEVVYPWISFEAYPVCVKMLSGTEVRVPLDGQEFDLDAVAAAVTNKTKLIFLANPNNPTGTAVSTEAIAKLVEAVPEDVLVVVDEAYREFCDPALGDPVADLVSKFRNVVVTRTFSKAYGLAGLRVGYAVGDPEVIAELDKVLLTFSVSGPAQAGALAALDSLDEIQLNVNKVIAERQSVFDALTAAGWDIPKPEGNFVWIPLAEKTSHIALELEKRGVVVRAFADVGIRVTIGTPDENTRFVTNFIEVGSA